MARLRKFCAYRKLERPYTRVSKYRELSYIRATPVISIAKFDMGDPKKRFNYILNLVSKTDLQIRHNAIESARMCANRLLEKTIGKNEYFMKIRMYPYHVLRENPLASGAGADRLSTGMARSFGKPIGYAAQIHEKKIMFSLSVNKQNLELAKKALKRAASKLPCPCLIQIEGIKKK